MNLILYAALFVFLVFVSPVLMVFRSYWGWRYGAFVISAWFLSLIIHGLAFQKALVLLGFTQPSWFSSSGFWWLIDTLFFFPVQTTLFNPEILSYLFAAGIILLPVQLVILWFMKLQDLPAGTTGHSWIENEELALESKIGMLVVLGFVFTMLVAETQAVWQFGFHGFLTAIILILGMTLSSAMGGKHRRVLVLDKTLNFGDFSFERKQKQYEPFERPPEIDIPAFESHSDPSADLDRIFSQRPSELAAMATVPVIKDEHED